MGQFIFRADASLEMGTGHVMRCLTLAHALKESGHFCHFICRDHIGNLGSLIEEQGFGLSLLDTPKKHPIEHGDKKSALAHASWLRCSMEDDAAQVKEVIAAISVDTIDCLIVDHYALDISWEKRFRGYADRLMIIDDLFDRKHDCDILVNQNLGVIREQYKNLVPVHCQILVGVTYAMLRPEFAQFRHQSLVNKSQFNSKQLLITMGGVDPDNYTERVLRQLKDCHCQSLEKIVIVLGETAPHKDSVSKLANGLSVDVELKVNVDNMAELMANADIAIGAAGSTSWERCCLGLPTLLFVIASNQSKSAELLEQYKAVTRVNVEVTNTELCVAVNRLLTDASFYKATSDAAALLCDGEGVHRVVSYLQS